MNRQEFFDNAVRGIIAQGRASSTKSGVCFYRHPHDPTIRCAVGHNISDDDYDESMELGVPRLHRDGDDARGPSIAKACGCENKSDVDFARQVQALHDGLSREPEERFIAAFRRDAELFAKYRGLTMPT